MISGSTDQDRIIEPPPSEPVPKAMRTRRLAVLLMVIFAIFVVGALIGPPMGAGLHKAWSALAGSKEGAGGHRGAARYYTCGMHPWVILPHPGSCPICGMKLVPLDPAKFSGQVTIDPVVAQNIGVRVEKVGGGSLGGEIRTVGTVEYDETRLADVNLKVSGWIEKLYVNYLGERVREGQPLFTLYSPDLYSTQEEYLLAYRAQRASKGGESSTRQLLEAARTKLSFFDIGPRQIEELEKRGAPVKTMTIRSPHSGVVIEKHAVEGMKVTPGMTAYRIADLSRVWVMATLYEYQSQQIKVGQRATMSLSYLPGQALEGKVVYIYPTLDQRTRQISVRLEFANPKRALKPGMYATVVFEGKAGDTRVLVPRAAVIDTGERQVAFVSRGQGRFEPRAVRMGGETADGKVEILEGLKPGELVVTSGQFLIDSEARMREALAKMMKGTPAAAPEVTPTAPGKAAPLALPPLAQRALGTALDGYLAAGTALSSDTARDIGVSARRVAEAMDAAMAVEIPGQPHFWHQHREARGVHEKAQALAAAGTIEEARRSFASLSAELGKLLRATGVPPSYGKQVEELHCPMYPDAKTGSVWLQIAGPVRNPYFGKAMLTCSDRRQPLSVTGSGAPRPAPEQP
jgi:membrane fusion protein, copper/silver efflux system